MKKLLSALLIFAIIMQTLCFTLCYAEIGGSVSGGGGSVSGGGGSVSGEGSGGVVVAPSFNKSFHTPYGATVKIKYYDYTNEFAITMSDFESETDAQIYTAIYKNDVLQEVFCDTYVANSLQAIDFVVSNYYETGEVDGLSDYTIKFFVWDENMKPLREAYNPIDYSYGLLGKINSREGQESVTLLTDNGEILTLQMDENYVIYDDSYTYTSLEEFEDEYSRGSVLGSYAYYTLNQGKIDKFYTMIWDYNHNGTNLSYNESPCSLGRNNIDKDSVVFFPAYNYDGSVNFEQSTIGTVADLSDDLCYTYTAYTNGYSKNGNRIVIKNAQPPYIADPGAISVITEVTEDFNNEGEDIYSISYYYECELYEDVPTSNEVYNNNKDLTAGDIVNIQIIDSVITNISKRVDFAEEVRDRDTGLISATTLASGDSTYTDDTQSYTYGYATDYYNHSTIAEINGDSYKLMLADYIYVVDNSGRNLTVDPGSVDDFEWNEDITADFDKYADWLFVREHEGSIKEVVIIKNVLDIR